MEYFITEDYRTNTAYYEFQKGKSDRNTFWKEDSLLLSDIIFRTLKLTKLFNVIPNFDPYDIIEVTKKQWEEVKELAASIGGEVKELIEEADIWARNNFESFDCFTIVGI
jgi:hypothetical protein